MKKILIFLFSIFIIVPFNHVVAETIPSKIKEYKKYSYVIDSYNIDIDVNENNTYDITETINVYFNKYKHGIVRNIPQKNMLKRTNVFTTVNRTKVTKIEINDAYTVTNENNNYQIKIGDKEKEIIGNKKYVISYNYNIGKDPLKNNDEFYYNIIGTDWDTVIGNITFTINMPKEFDESKIGFSRGKIDEVKNDNIEFNVIGNTIQGKYNGILEANEAITIRLELNKDYFVGDKTIYDIKAYILIIFPIIFTFITIILWYIYGKDEKVVETVEFYPPDNLNSLEIGMLYNGKAKEKDVISFMIYLANKGYIHIEEIEERKLFSNKNSFKITKIKEYDGSDINEKSFLDGLFKEKEIVTSEDLYNKFYKTINSILINTNSKERKYRIFEKTSINISNIITLILISSLLLSIILPVLEVSFLVDIQSGITFFLILMYVFFTLILISNNFSIFNPITIIFLVSFLPIIIILIDEKLYLLGIILNILCIMIMSIYVKKMPKRTLYGNQMLGKIKGFKNFLETVEKDKIEAMVSENPNYFYDILPYTYVLDISDKWISKFENIALKEAEWYKGTNINTLMTSTMNNVTRVMTSSKSTNRSTGSSSANTGGGMAGRGSGGGGGTSW